MGDGKLKLYLTAVGLRYRRAHPGLFSGGSYRRLQVIGSKSEHVLAFERKEDTESAIVIVPRFGSQWAQGSALLGLESIAWEDTRISYAGEKSPVLLDLVTATAVTPTGDGSISLADLPDFFPGWLLVPTDAFAPSVR
jgi:(1->4)-alpha-D-glucan 1-alpha-D-glucosylmutase